MTYPEAADFLLSLTDFERLGFHRHFAETVSLDSPRRLLELLGNPHHVVPAVHIAGTKGKGSTAAMLERVLREAGYRTGLFTSPHLVSFRERVRVNGESIAEDAISRLVSQVQPAVMQIRQKSGLTPSTFFEAYFALAALHFAAEGVDLAIYETGLGGRLDATNLVTPLVAAITTIGYDHMAILGDTLDAIAREKAGVAKPEVPLVIARNQPDEALGAIRQVAERTGVEVVFGPEVTRREPPTKAAVSPDGSILRPLDTFGILWGRQTCLPGAVSCSLFGAHQATNLGVALGMLEKLGEKGYTVSAEQLQTALPDVRWPGRFDIRRARPWLVLDCAHNPESARALARALPEYLNFDRLVLVVGMSEDKDIAGFAGAFVDLQPDIILTRAAIERALPAEELRRRAEGAWDEAEAVEGVREACERATELAGAEGAVCVTGSFYVVGEAMEGLAQSSGPNRCHPGESC